MQGNFDYRLLLFRTQAGIVFQTLLAGSFPGRELSCRQKLGHDRAHERIRVAEDARRLLRKRILWRRKEI